MPDSATSTPPTPATSQLRFESLADILAHAERIGAGPRETTGRWTAPQIIDHVRRTITCSRTGFPGVRMPLYVRIAGRLLRRRFLSKPMPSGVKFPQSAAALFAPPDDVTMDEALVALREEVALSEQPGAMRQPSPVLGPMTHDDWVRLHCRHAEMHFRFAPTAPSAC